MRLHAGKKVELGEMFLILLNNLEMVNVTEILINNPHFFNEHNQEVWQICLNTVKYV